MSPPRAPTSSASDALTRLPEAAVARFRDCVHALSAPPSGRLALGVSGGADSMAMLALAARAFPGEVVAATVDHGLRQASAAEAALVARACAAIGVPHAVLKLDVLAPGNLHDAARQARYRALDAWAAAQQARAIATAHHADDQAETFLMRAVRGAGVAGLAGIRAARRGGSAALPVLRPLLDWRRAELRALAEAAGLGFVDDPSNDDSRFERARMRRLIAANPALDVAGLARAASHAAAAEAALGEATEWLWADRCLSSDAECCCVDLSGLPAELRRRLVRRAMAVVLRNEAPAMATVEPIMTAVRDQGSGTQAGVLARAEGEHWHFCKAPPRRSH